jgi:ADP-ribose pyrophosphatase
MEPHLLYRGKFLEMVVKDTWEFVQRKAGASPVGIAAVTPDGNFLLISQFRIPIGKTCIEIPAGLVGDTTAGESWRTAARRELEEETGWTATHFEKLTEGPTSAGLTSECVLVARATGLSKAGEQHLDGNEQITVHEIPLGDVHDWLQAREREGALVDPKVWTALYFLSRE